MAEIFIYAAVFSWTFWGVRAFVRWSGGRKVLQDIPNERSSHTRPTARGGGAVFVAACLIFYVAYTILFARDFCWQYFAGALLIASISWLDDLRSISFVWRFAVHAAAAVLLVQTICVSPFDCAQTISAGGGGTVLGICVFGAAVLWLVWMTNAYNFMDGIDGIAAAQAVAAGFGWLLVGKLWHLETISLFGGVIAFANLGFLIFNWQPAKVFMGDVGSAFLGFTFAAMPFLAARGSGAGVK